MPSDPKRKLAAIMFTDMVGYTALMQDDEPKARELIQRHRELMKPLIEKHSGIILQYVGDGTFITFDSAIEAVNCGYEIQKELNSDKKLSLRIGIHIGDVVVEGDEVYGDGVNVASRLEPLAEAGGICISHQVYENIKNQPGIKANLLGEKALKNVDHPIKIYCLIGDGLKAAKPFDENQKTDVVSKESVLEELKTKPASKKLLTWAVGAVVLLILFLGRGWFAGESSITEVTADENSLAVLFIENTTDPTDADKSAEMIRNLLSTDLAQSHSLRVIGSQRLYDIAKQERKGEGQLIDRSNASAVARKAGAQWMLTGSLAKVGNRMVLTTEIENVRNGKVLDAQRADGSDIFSLVDALSSEIRSDMGVIAATGEIDAPVREITTSSSEAYQLYLEGLEFLNELNYEEAIENLTRAVEIDSKFTKALYKLAVAQWWYYSGGGDLIAKETVKKILLNKERLAEGELLLVEGLESLLYDDYSKAIEIYQSLLILYPDEKEIHYGMGEAYFHSGKGEYLKALAAFEEAINLDPKFRLAYAHIFDIYLRDKMYNRGIRVANRLIKASPDKASGYQYLADIYGLKGEIEKSINNYEKAAELNKGNYMSVALQGWAYRIGGKYEEALSKYEELFKPDVPDVWQFRGRVISSYVYAEQGQYKKAIQLKREARRIVGPDNKIDIFLNIAFLADNYLSIGDTVRVFPLLDSALAINPDIDAERYVYWQKGRLYAGSGNEEELKKLIDNMRTSTIQTGETNRWDILLKIELLRLQGDIHNALMEFDKLDLLSRLFSLDMKASLYSVTNDWENVILTANEMQGSFLFGYILSDSRNYNYPRTFYIKGIAYEEMGKPELAIKNYEALLELWKDADEEIPVRRDAIKRLAALKQKS